MGEEFKNQKIKRTFMTLFIITLSITYIQAQLLWKVSKEGLSDSYIFGTHHIIPSKSISSIEGLQAAYSNSETIIGEINISEMSDLSEVSYMGQAMMAPKDSLLESIIGKGNMDDLKTIMEKYPNEQVSIEMINYLKPHSINTLLTLSITQSIIKKILPNDNSPLGIDFIFQQKALSEGKEVYGLESLRYQTDMLYNSESILEAGQKLKQLIDCIKKHKDFVEASLTDMTETYLKQDLNLLYTSAHQPKNEDVCPTLQMSPKEWKTMVDDRNKAWIPLLTEQISKQSCFIAVGALHLPGEMGIIKLLRKEGYNVEPVKQ